VLSHEVRRGRTLSMPWRICERGSGSRERKHCMQEQQEQQEQPSRSSPRAGSGSAERPVSSPTHPGAPRQQAHTHRRALSRHTPGARARAALAWQQPHWQQPHTGSSHTLAAATLQARAGEAATHRRSSSHTLAAATHWQQPHSRRAPVKQAGARRARARARTFVHRVEAEQINPSHPLISVAWGAMTVRTRQPSPSAFTRRAP
jgi:hypothetical protein